MQKGRNAKEAIGKAWSKFFHIAGVPGIQADTPYFVSAVRETQKWGKFSFIRMTPMSTFVLLHTKVRNRLSVVTQEI